LLKIFWNNHNPTTLNRQGPDVGTQYRSVVFFHTPEQENVALEMKKNLNPVAKEKFNAEIITEIKPAQEFHRAEEYHQQYLEKSNL
jgi:peptide-methionine (S)-S-oxide reductase